MQQWLTIYTAVRALRNPELFKHEHFHQAAAAVATGVFIHLIVQIPVRFLILFQDLR